MSIATLSRTLHPRARGFTEQVLDEVRDRIKASDRVLREARARRDLIREASMQFPGTERSFRSGSIAHGTVNAPVLDADAGVVLARASYPDVGPDGDGIGPSEIVQTIRDFLREAVIEEYPGARLFITKRAIKVTFDANIEGQDPTVDLVVAIDRVKGPGLWIPNTEADRWDPSHPEKHSELVHTANSRTGSAYARIVRLAKANNRAYSDPALSSFNITALALSSPESGSLAGYLLAFFEYSTRDLSRRLTPDPAGVSGPIKVPSGDRQIPVRRLLKATDALARAIAHDDDEAIVREALTEIFPHQLRKMAGSPYVDRLRADLDSGSGSIRVGTAIAVGTSTVGRAVKPTRSHGERGYGAR